MLSTSHIQPNKKNKIIARLIKYIDHSPLLENIDVTQMSRQESQLLYKQLIQSPQTILRIKHHILIARKSKKYDHEHPIMIYEVLNLNKIFGEGINASVFESDGTLKFSNDGFMIFKPKEELKKRLVKVQPNASYFTKRLFKEDKVNKEYHNNKIVGNLLHCKSPVFFKKIKQEIVDFGKLQEVNFSFFIMRIAKGNTFDEVVEKNHYNHFSILDKLSIAIAILSALKELHAKDIVHRDAHGGNIIINLEKEPLAFLIDYGDIKIKNFLEKEESFEDFLKKEIGLVNFMFYLFFNNMLPLKADDFDRDHLVEPILKELQNFSDNHDTNDVESFNHHDMIMYILKKNFNLYTSLDYLLNELKTIKEKVLIENNSHVIQMKYL